MSTPAKFATQEEFQRLTIRVEVLSADVHRLGQAVGDIAEDLNELRAEMNSRFDAMGELIADGHAALLSAILGLAPR